MGDKDTTEKEEKTPRNIELWLKGKPMSNTKISSVERFWVYFDSNGNEIYRQSNIHNKTFVQVLSKREFNPAEFPQKLPAPMLTPSTFFSEFKEVPMPGIIPVKYNYSGSETKLSDLTANDRNRYNRYDFQIAAYVYIFNRDKKNNIVPIYNQNMLTLPSIKVPDLNPTRVKAMIFLETDAGARNIKDIMQAMLQGTGFTQKLSLAWLKELNLSLN